MSVKRYSGLAIRSLVDLLRNGISRIFQWWHEHPVEPRTDREILTNVFGPRLLVTDRTIRAGRDRYERSRIVGEILEETGKVSRGGIPVDPSIPNAYQYQIRICVGDDPTEGCIEATVNSGSNMTYEEIRQRGISLSRNQRKNDRFGTNVFKARASGFSDDEIRITVLTIFRRT